MVRCPLHCCMPLLNGITVLHAEVDTASKRPCFRRCRRIADRRRRTFEISGIFKLTNFRFWGWCYTLNGASAVGDKKVKKNARRTVFCIRSCAKLGETTTKLAKPPSIPDLCTRNRAKPRETTRNRAKQDRCRIFGVRRIIFFLFFSPFLRREYWLFCMKKRPGKIFFPVCVYIVFILANRTSRVSHHWH